MPCVLAAGSMAVLCKCNGPPKAACVATGETAAINVRADCASTDVGYKAARNQVDLAPSAVAVLVRVVVHGVGAALAGGCAAYVVLAAQVPPVVQSSRCAARRYERRAGPG